MNAKGKNRMSGDKPSAYYDRMREEMLEYVPEGVERAVEFGCGDGHFSWLVQEKYGAECWGVEVEKDPAKRAVEKLYKIINCDAGRALPLLPDGYFDCVIFNDVLEHLYDPYKLLADLRVKLRDGATVVASVPNVRYWTTLKNLVCKAKWEYKDSGTLDFTHIRFFTYKEIRAMFEGAGYEILRLDGINPTKSKTLKAFNAMAFNRFWDVQYRQFACAARLRR